MSRHRSNSNSAGPAGHFSTENWTPAQLGTSTEMSVEAAIIRQPGIADPHSPAFLGTKKHMVDVLTSSLDVVHPQVTAGNISNTWRGGPDSFNRSWPSSRAFKVSTGGEVHVGCNEAGWTATTGGQNLNRFTHAVEARNDSSSKRIRGRVGPGQREFVPGRWKHFDVNKCMKKGNFNPRTGCISDEVREMIFDLILWIGQRLATPGQKVLVYCDLAAWVNEIALLLQYGPASTALDNGRNSGCSDTRKTSNEVFINKSTKNNSSNIGSCI